MKHYNLSFLAILFTLSTMAQKPLLIEGQWKSLTSIEKFDLEFDYSDIEIPDFDKEEDYIAVKMKEKEESNPGDGLIWKEKYYSDRDVHYEPRFVESFNKRGDEKSSEDYNDSEYVLKVHTTKLYHGWNVGVMRKPARIDAIISIYKRGEETAIFKVKYEDVKGADAMGYDFSIHSRVAEAYAKLAKSFLRDLKRKA
ncbi:hypothetical protein [Gelidibacter salicanalis]|uniref:Uncharacterized protein n=1 Tax=Gelidibacter salicanalis TaxID=291193 RepID=A0A934KI36_9FLAO|nr:hypothetical protein [Gelidibacter salicanalis]MBJ7879382.1 hypothetical protein [Gelidibacter salicanalis]